MTAHAWLAVAALVAGAGVLAWPARRRAVPGAPLAGAVPGAPLAGAVPGGSVARVVAASPGSGRAGWVPGWLPGGRGSWHRHPRRAVLAAALAGAVAGWLTAGPVLAALAAGYGGLVTRAAVRRSAARDGAAARSRTLDDLSAIAADLRAGLPPAAVLPEEQPAADGDRVRHLVGAVRRIAEHTGAPAADLVERIEADARAADRARASAAAQAAGARATAVLLAALPAGGTVLGYAIGADPLAVLLHTPLGAACALGAMVLQAAGLAWADRLAAAGQP